MKIELQLASAEAQRDFGRRLAGALAPPCVIYLNGDLGTGKTTLARGILSGLGHAGAVRSPTYTLIEPYELAGARVHHLDLYRLGDAEELDYLGLRDLMGEDAVWIIEWPERGAGMLPAADLLIRIGYRDSGRSLRLTALTAAGEAALSRLGDHPSREPAEFL